MKKLIIWFVVLGGVGYGGAKAYLHHKVGSGMDTAVAMMSPFVSVEYDGVSSTMSGELTIDGIRARVNGYRHDIYIDRIGIDTANFLELLKLGDLATGLAKSGSEAPDYLRFMVEGIHIPADADYYREFFDLGIEMLDVDDFNEAAPECVGKYGLSPTALAGLGYEEQVVSMAVEFKQDDSRFHFKTTVAVEDMVDVVIDMAMVGDMTSQFSLGASNRPKISNLSLEVIDRSLNRRTVNYCKERGLSADETLLAQLDAFQYMGESVGIVFGDSILGPYADFLAGESIFRVAAQPINPVDLTRIDLYKPSDVPALLNLSATTISL